MPTRRHFKGSATPTRLNGSVNASVTTMNIDDATGWPGDASLPFYAVIDRGLSNQEVVLVGSRSGTTLNTVTRGQADTVAAGHDDNAVIEHVGTKVDLDEANAHTAGTETDPHSTGANALLNNTRHDLSARHGVGSVIAASATATDLAATDDGSSNDVSRGNHSHGFAAGTAYTPTWTGSGSNPSIGNGGLGGRYWLVGKILFLRIQLTVGSTTAFGTGQWSFGLPVGINADVAPPGQITDQTLLASVQVGLKFLPSRARTGGTQITVYCSDDSPDTVLFQPITNTYPQAWFLGDQVIIQGWLEVQ